MSKQTDSELRSKLHELLDAFTEPGVKYLNDIEDSIMQLIEADRRKSVEQDESLNDALLAVWVEHDIADTLYEGQYMYTVICTCGQKERYNNTTESKVETIGRHIVQEMQRVIAQLSRPNTNDREESKS